MEIKQNGFKNVGFHFKKKKLKNSINTADCKDFCIIAKSLIFYVGNDYSERVKQTVSLNVLYCHLLFLLLVLTDDRFLQQLQEYY